MGRGSWEFWAAFVLFVLAATANGAGYRYGASDQAFYIPVITRAVQPAAYPHDASLIDSQGRLMLTDEIIAGIVRVTGIPLEYLFLTAYLLSLLLFWMAITAIGRRLYTSMWLTAALAAALTLRHRIPATTANSFEPYFHPRVLAFGVGTLLTVGVDSLLSLTVIRFLTGLGLGAALLGTLAYAFLSYYIARSGLPGRKLVDTLSWLPWGLPGVLIGLAVLWVVLGSGGVLQFMYGTILVLILAIVIKEMPLGTQIIKAGVMQIASSL